MDIIVEFNGKEIKLGKAVQNKQRTTLNIVSANGKINLLIDGRNCNKGNQKAIRKIYGEIEKAVRKLNGVLENKRINLDVIVENNKVAGLETRFISEGRNIITNKEELTVFILDKNNLYNVGDFKTTSDSLKKGDGVNGKIKGTVTGEQITVKVDIGLASDFINYLTEKVKTEEKRITVIDLEQEKISYDMSTGIKVTTNYAVAH